MLPKSQYCFKKGSYMINIPRIFSSFFALNVNKISYGKISRKNVGNVGNEKSFESWLLLPGEKRYFFFLWIKVWRWKKYLCENKEWKKFLFSIFAKCKDKGGQISESFSLWLKSPKKDVKSRASALSPWASSL